MLRLTAAAADGRVVGVPGGGTVHEARAQGAGSTWLASPNGQPLSVSRLSDILEASVLLPGLGPGARELIF